MIPLADIENTLFHIAEALRVPVLVAALLCLAVVLVEFGRFLVELVGRRGRGYAVLQDATEQALLALAHPRRRRPPPPPRWSGSRPARR